MFFDKETDFNFLTNSNNAKIISCTSQTKGCSSTNTLNEERKVNYLFKSEHLAFRTFIATNYNLRFRFFE